MKTKTKKIKPIDSDVHFKYICPNKQCLNVHWLSLKETQTPNFIVICDCCNEIFKPKRIKNISITYVNTKKTITKTDKATTIENFDFLDEATKTLLHFGFHKEEADQMIKTEYEKTGSTNPATLVKNSLDFLGGKNG